MNKLLSSIILLTLGGASSASAQYYSIINQATNALSAPLSGSARYKGFVEASYVKGLGDLSANFFEITTTQGYQYTSWFYMGVGLGVQFVHSTLAQIPFSTPEGIGSYGYDRWDDYNRSKQNGVMIPLYTDFRFTPWGVGMGAYIDLRAGCDFLIGNRRLAINNGYLTNQQYFYFKPSIGFRLPLTLSGSKQAFDLGFSYQMLTGNYWGWGWNSSSQVLSSIGVSLGFEW
ncbi:MAG: hypothetical protein HDS26_00530 [Bacteroides sp.]|nr:hypothetical protein [Bacteroides sp.]